MYLGGSSVGYVIGPKNTVKLYLLPFAACEADKRVLEDEVIGYAKCDRIRVSWV